MDIWLEWVGTIFGLLAVALTAKKKIACWPLGLVSVVAFGILFARIKLYSDAALQVFYFATGIYGWWAWLRGAPNGGALEVSTLRGSTRLSGLLGLGVATLVGGFLMATYTDASLPYWDMATTLMSLCAQLLLLRKIFESWALWIAVDVISIGVYIAKEVYVTAGLYAVFLVLASWGFVAWARDLRVNKVMSVYG